MKQPRSQSRRVALLGMMCAVAFALSYLEALLPIPGVAPGVKLGLANIAVMFALYAVDAKAALVVAFAKVVLSGILFASPFGFICSACGTAFALTSMVVLGRARGVDVVAVGVVAALAHNAGQLFAVAILVDTAAVWAYAPVLAVAGCVTGCITGILTKGVLKALGNEAPKWEEETFDEGRKAVSQGGANDDKSNGIR